MNQGQNLQDSRSLRSKGTKDVLNDNKFDFDEEEYSIDPNKRFLVLHSEVRKSNQKDPTDRKQEAASNNYDHAKIKMDKLDVEKSKGLITSMILNIKTNKIGGTDDNNVETLIDPLSDETYMSFHKKMLKQENRMHQFDVNQGVNEAERLELIYDKLDLPNWVSTLQRVTVINDPTDGKELLKKKILTKQHIKSLLYKYDRMQKRDRLLQKTIKKFRYVPIQRTPKIYQNLDRKCDLDYHSSSDEEDDESTIDNSEICRRRLLRREAQCGGSVVIGISNTELHKSKFVIMAEPLKKPYIFKTSKKEKQDWKNFSGLPRTLQGNVRTNNRIAELKQKILIPLTLTAERVSKKIVDDNAVSEAKKKNNKNGNNLKTDNSTELKDSNGFENKSVIRNHPRDEKEHNSICKNKSDKPLEAEKSYISSLKVSHSSFPLTSMIKEEKNIYGKIMDVNKENITISTTNGSCHMLKSRSCVSEPCRNQVIKENTFNNLVNSNGVYPNKNINERKIKSVEENTGSAQLTFTIGRYDPINSKNIMSISNIINSSSYNENCFSSSSSIYKNNGEINDVNILKV